MKFFSILLAFLLLSQPSYIFAFNQSPLITGDGHQWYGAIHGKYVAYLSNEKSTWSVKLYDTKTTKSLVLSGGGSVPVQQAPSIHKKFVVWEESGNIFLYNISSKTTQNLTPGLERQSRPVVSGNNVAWLDNSVLELANEITILNLKTGEKTVITNGSADVISFDLDANRLVWEDNRAGNHNTNLYLYHLDSEVTELLVSAPNNQRFPRIDDSILTWQDHRVMGNGGAADIYYLDFSDGVERVVTSSVDYEGYPVTDGDNIAYVNFSSGQGDIFNYNIHSNTLTQITDHPTTQSQVAIFGDTLLWSDYQNGAPDLYTTTLP